MNNTFKILGSGAGPGVPSFFCDCVGCQTAHSEPSFARTRSGAFITTENYHLLVDMPPDLRAQLIREKIALIDQIFLTHWHYDHFGGLGELEYYVKLQRGTPLPLYLPPSAMERFQLAFPDWLDIFTIGPWEFFKTYRFDSLTITPLPANHSVETAGFLVETASKRLAYFPDTAGLPEESLRRVEGVDWFVGDATFFGSNWFPHSHMSVDETVDLGRRIKARQIVLTHLSIHYSRPMSKEMLQAIPCRNPDVLIASDGMSFTL